MIKSEFRQWAESTINWLRLRCREGFDQIRGFANRTVIAWAGAIRFLVIGLKTWFQLTRQKGHPWVHTTFPSLQVHRLLKHAACIACLGWVNRNPSRPDPITNRRLAGIQRRLLLLSDGVGPTTSPAQKVLRATFARCAATIIERPLPGELVLRLRADRSLRDLLTTWIDLLRHGAPRNTSDALFDALSLQSVMVLPLGSRLPAEMITHLGDVRKEFDGKLGRTKREIKINQLHYAITQWSLKTLVVPMAYSKALKASNHNTSDSV